MGTSIIARRSCDANLGPRIRACTHLDVSAAMIEETVSLVREIVRKA